LTQLNKNRNPMCILTFLFIRKFQTIKLLNKILVAYLCCCISKGKKAKKICDCFNE